MCRGSGHLPELTVIGLTGAMRDEMHSQYHEDTHILPRLGASVVERTVQGTPAALRELAHLITTDYDLELGFETVSRPLKRDMLLAARRITRVVGPKK